MRIITSHHYGGNSTNLVLKDEDNNIVVVFEDKSSVMGNKVAVYDDDGNGIYFLDEDMSQGYDAFSIQKGAESCALVLISRTLVHSLIDIKSRKGNYSYAIFTGILTKDDAKIAKLIRRNKDREMKVELYVEDDIHFIITLLYAIELLLGK